MLEDVTQGARVVLLRHPQIQDPAREAALGQKHAELSRRGREQTLALIRAFAPLHFDAIYSAPTTHCKDTAQAVAQDHGISYESTDGLLDQSLGEWEGRSWAELRQEEEAYVRDFFTDYGLISPPGGESLADAVDRSLAWWSETIDGLLEKTVVLVAAAPILSGFAARLLGITIRRAPSLSLPPAGFGILDVYRDGAFLRAWNPSCLDEQLP